MAKTVVLNCKKVAPNGSIAGVGGIEQSTTTQKHYTEVEAIAAIDVGSIRFEVHGADGQVALVRVSHHGNHRFLETHRDETKTDNLAELPICQHQAVHPVPVTPPYRPAPVQRGHCVFISQRATR